MLDEYWYYSLFTLVMLFLFEIMVANQRHRNISMIRQMSNDPKPFYVLRNKKWIQLMSDEILPNDLISITKMSENEIVPCDILLLDGKCVVNEALLTGESTPQMKENISSILEQEDDLDLKKHSRNIIFSGTRVMQKDSLNLRFFWQRTVIKLQMTIHVLDLF
jgi:manganese-transporting P-type ATPase